MSRINRRTAIQSGLIAGGSIAILSGCKGLEGLPDIEVAGISSRSVIRTGNAIAKAAEDITPEQEYYIGRAVSANIYSKYKPFINESQSSYLNMVGQHLALSSDVPETFGGYHFALLDSEDINAFAAPGGFIFVTRGMLKCCQHEDALAAVLAHEISHVQLKHGLSAIEKSRITDAFVIIGTEAASNLAGADLKNLVNIFEGSISDITKTMITNGYSRSSEYEADKLAVKIMGKSGYLNRGMGDMLSEMEVKLKPGGADFFKTHPSPKNRVEELADSLDKSTKVPDVRTQRLRTQLGLA